MQFYAINKETNKLKYASANLYELKNIISLNNEAETDFYLLQDIDMKYISRITYVDDVCVYNSKAFWMSSQPDEIIADYENHTVKDFLGEAVGITRFQTEMNNNRTRLADIDGLAGEIDYNMTVGNEFIALFREECVKTDFNEITPLEIGIKLDSVISLVQTGSFREAKQVLQTLETDAFLTQERMTKYIAMMEAADVIEYATGESYFYTASAEE